jgi:N-acetylglucosamine malate deacetylase 1
MNRVLSPLWTVATMALAVMIFLAAETPAQTGGTKNDGKLHIIAFGAHPDDCELKAGGVAVKWAALGHHVKFV